MQQQAPFTSSPGTGGAPLDDGPNQPGGVSVVRLLPNNNEFEPFYQSALEGFLPREEWRNSVLPRLNASVAYKSHYILIAPLTLVLIAIFGVLTWVLAETNTLYFLAIVVTLPTAIVILAIVGNAARIVKLQNRNLLRLEDTVQQLNDENRKRGLRFYAHSRRVPTIGSKGQTVLVPNTWIEIRNATFYSQQQPLPPQPIISSPAAVSLMNQYAAGATATMPSAPTISYPPSYQQALVSTQLPSTNPSLPLLGSL